MARPILVVRIPEETNTKKNTKYLKKSISKALGNEYNVIILNDDAAPLSFEIVE